MRYFYLRHNNAEAMAHARSVDFDVILSDVHSGQGGIEVYRRLRESGRTRAVSARCGTAARPRGL